MAVRSLSVLTWRPHPPFVLLLNMGFAISLLSEPQSSCTSPPSPRFDRGSGAQVTVETAQLWLWELRAGVRANRGQAGCCPRPGGVRGEPRSLLDRCQALETGRAAMGAVAWASALPGDFSDARRGVYFPSLAWEARGV